MTFCYFQLACEAHGLIGLTSAAAEGEPGKEPQLVSRAFKFIDMSAAAAGALNVLFVFPIIRTGFLKRDATFITSIFEDLHGISPLALKLSYQPLG